LSLFAGFYYWIGKISGYNFNEKWALIHFWTFLIAINIVFLPMHFLGLNGKPRRIPDYADGYAGWNEIMSKGSIMTVLSVILFLYIVSNSIFINKKYYLDPVNYSKFII
jgi:cytochrome c oxidase subunit 1